MVLQHQMAHPDFRYRVMWAAACVTTSLRSWAPTPVAVSAAMTQRLVVATVLTVVWNRM